MTWYSIEPRTRIYVEVYGFFPHARNQSNKYTEKNYCPQE